MARRSRSRLRFWSLILLSFWALPDLAHAESPAAAMRRTVWSAETIRLLREASDYNSLLSIVFSEYAATRRNYRRDRAAFQRDLARLQALAVVPATTSLDKDLNPVVFRAMLEQLRSANIIDREYLNRLIAEISRQPAGLSEEDSLLPLSVTTTKAAFSGFLREHVDGAFAAARTAPVAYVVSQRIGGSAQFPSTAATAQAVITGASLPSGIKTQLLAVANGGSLNQATLVEDAVKSLQQTTQRFREAHSTLAKIASGQSFLALPAPNSELAGVAAGLVRSAPSSAEVFDVLAGVATQLPLPPAVKSRLADIANIGNTIESTVSTVSRVSSSLSSLGSLGSVGLSFLTTGGIGALAGSLGSILGGGVFGGGPSNQEILDAVKQVGEDVKRLHKDMDARFDRVDRQLSEINAKIDGGFADLSDKLAATNVRISEVVAATADIESTILSQGRDINRLAVNTLGFWNQEKLQELHDHVRVLTDGLRRADGGNPDLSLEDFRNLSGYFRNIAKYSAAQSPLNGLQPTAESYDAAAVAGRLSAHDLYPVNYLLLYTDTADPISRFIPGPLAARNLAATPLVNERAWAIASNALASMVERWPQFAREIPRADFDAIVANGRDLQQLIAALGDKTTDDTNPFLDTLRRSYERAQTQFAAAMQQALEAEVSALGSTLRLSAERTAVIAAGLHIDGPPTVDFVPSSVSITGCYGENAPHSVAPPVVTKALYGPQVALAAALNTVTFGGCIGSSIGSMRSANAEHSGYHLSYGGRDVGPVCQGLSRIDYAMFQPEVQLWAKLASDADDAAHRSYIGTAQSAVREVEYRMTPISGFHWSGFNPGQGFDDLNGDCARNYNGREDLQYLIFDQQAYYNSTWQAIADGLQPVRRRYLDFVPYNALDSARRDPVEFERTVEAANERSLLSIHSALLEDVIAILENKPQMRLSATAVAGLIGGANALDAAQAMLRSAAQITFEQGMQCDDALHGLLFGSEAVPGRLELVDFAEQQILAKKPSIEILRGTTALPSIRLPWLTSRLRQLMSVDLQTNRVPEGHTLLDNTLNRLVRVGCLVPQEYLGPASCGSANRGSLVLPAARARDRVN